MRKIIIDIFIEVLLSYYYIACTYRIIGILYEIIITENIGKMKFVIFTIFVMIATAMAAFRGERALSDLSCRPIGLPVSILIALMYI